MPSIRPSILAVLAIAATLVLTPAGLAGKGAGGGKPGSGSGSLSLVVLSSPASDSAAHFRGTVTFAVSTTATSMPWVTVTCSQNGALVYRMSNGIFPSSLNQVFTLGPTPSWQAGAADCIAKLENWDRYPRITTLGSTTFRAQA